jgi:hypothetical protein
VCAALPEKVPAQQVSSIASWTERIRTMVCRDGQPQAIYDCLRLEGLAALEMVDYVTVFSEDTPYQLIKELPPDVLVKGADYAGKPGAQARTAR